MMRHVTLKRILNHLLPIQLDLGWEEKSPPIIACHIDGSTSMISVVQVVSHGDFHL